MHMVGILRQHLFVLFDSRWQLAAILQFTQIIRGDAPQMDTGAEPRAILMSSMHHRNRVMVYDRIDQYAPVAQSPFRSRPLHRLDAIIAAIAPQNHGGIGAQ